MADDAPRHLDFTRRHAPLLRGRLDEHGARDRPGVPVALPRARTLDEPPVPWTTAPREVAVELRVACTPSTRTCDQSASSSSATRVATPV